MVDFPTIVGRKGKMQNGNWYRKQRKILGENAHGAHAKGEQLNKYKKSWERAKWHFEHEAYGGLYVSKDKTVKKTNEGCV